MSFPCRRQRMEYWILFLGGAGLVSLQLIIYLLLVYYTHFQAL